MADAAILKKNRKNAISRRHNSLQSIFTKFGKMTQVGRICPVDRKNSHFLKSKMADGRHCEKPLIRHNSATVGQTAMKFGKMMHFDL